MSPAKSATLPRTVRGLLRVAVGEGPLHTEHARLLRTALRRGELDPEGALDSAKEEAKQEAKQEASIASRHPTERLRIAQKSWLLRMAHEHRSAAVFSRLLPQLMVAGASLDLKTAVLRMSMDELRHAGLCGGVVELLGGVAEVETELSTLPLPEHEDATPEEAALRNALFVSFCETVSLALLTEERELCTEPAIRAVITQLGADEVLHARLGWSYLAERWPSLDEAARARTEAYLPVALGHLEREMLAAMPLPEGARGADLPEEEIEALASLGVLHSRSGREILYAVLGEAILPRLISFGMDAEKAWKNRISTKNSN